MAHKLDSRYSVQPTVSDFNEVTKNQRSDSENPPMQIIWKNVFLMSALHVFSIYALSRIPHCYLKTLLFGVGTYIIGGIGTTAGAHRLWTHRSYKAKFPLRVLLMIFNSIGLQNSIFDWARDHRTHHKYSETNADPHNARRGFFFSHVGWLLVRKHLDVARRGKTIPLDDLLEDPVVTFQRRCYVPLALTCCFLLPTLVPWYFWGESIWNAYCISALRYCLSLNMTWTVNSLAHIYGSRPYDKTIHPAENLLVAFFTTGEGFHNYHHTFPQDYATSEFGMRFNITTAFINFMAFLGQVQDRRTVPKGLIEARKKRTGIYSNLEEVEW